MMLHETQETMSNHTEANPPSNATPAFETAIPQPDPASQASENETPPDTTVPVSENAIPSFKATPAASEDAIAKL